MELNACEVEGRTLKFKACDESILIPGCILYSRGGTIPHLTAENMTAVSCENNLWHVPLETIFEQPGLDVMEKYGKSFHEFISEKKKILLLNTSDTYLGRPEIYSYNEEKSVSIWAPGGRRKVTPDDYMKYLETFGFDVCIPPSDTVPECSSKKRNRKSYDRTIRFLDRCLQIKREKNLNVPVLGVIEGGDSKFEREKCAKEVFSRNVDGYVLSGFDRIPSKYKEMLELCMNELKDNKVKIMFGVLTPVEVVTAVELGVDVFDSVISYYASERGCALNFVYTQDKLRHRMEKSTSAETTSCESSEESPAKDRKNIDSFEINLNDKIYFDDTRSLVEECQCYCCQRYVRAYVHHLLVTKEMLAQVLLMMHNLHHWLDFFKEIRESGMKDTLAELKDILLNNS